MYDLTSAEETGFPLKCTNNSIQAARFEPWYERQCKRQLEQGRRAQYKEHQRLPSILPYGFQIKMSTDLLGNYKTIATGEAFLQVRPSLVVGIGGGSTGFGLFTLKEIPPSVWITSYAPLAPVCYPSRVTNPPSDYVLKTTREGREVEIDGSACPFGLGRIIQDGSFPFCLATERFTSIIKNRVNCEWSVREGEIWFRSTRAVHAGEELLTRYSHDNSYWTALFTANQLAGLREALLSVAPNSQTEAERAIRSYHLV